MELSFERKYSMFQIRLFLLAALILLLTGVSGSAEIYRWKSRDGQIHYSSSPPSYLVVGPIEVKYNDRWRPYTGQESFPQFYHRHHQPDYLYYELS